MTFDFDLIIVGAGPVGLTVARGLAQRSATRALSVALIDQQSGAPIDDPRTLALSHGSRRLLAPLGWPEAVTPIKRIHISQRGHFGRALIDCRAYDLPALGYAVSYGALMRALIEPIDMDGPLQHFTRATAHTPLQDTESVTLPIETEEGSRQLRARLLIHAAGSAAALASVTGAHCSMRDYRQSALLGFVRVATPQEHLAWERFTCEGPIALLPVGHVESADYALVWCGAADDTQRRMVCSAEVLLDELAAAFGARMGRFISIDRRAIYPLRLQRVAPRVQGRVVVIGNAAQTLHPVAGQGLNLGLRDACALVDTLSNGDITPQALADFAHRRQLDRKLTITITDWLARAFSAGRAERFAPVYSTALTALECLPLVKHALAQQMIFGQRR